MKRYPVLMSLTLVIAVMVPIACADDSMQLQQRQSIEHECERLVYKFLKFFEFEHAKSADLFTEDGQAFDNVGRETIREAFSKIDPQDIEVNVLLSSNLVIDVSDKDHATGAGYVMHFQDRHPDPKREGRPILRLPKTVTWWEWEFEQEDGNWRISKLTMPQNVMMREDVWKMVE